VSAVEADEPTEVVIEGQLPPAVRSMGRAEARQLPGAFGDPVRSIEVMPGVAPIVSGLPLFFIRGAPPGNVGFFIDGIRVPLLYHALLGPSVLHPALIGSVELYPGAYPAHLGQFSGAIVQMQLAEPSETFGGEAQVRLYDAGTFVNAPIAEGRGHVMAGGRYSYTGLILSQVTNARLEYWDYQALAGYDLTPKDRVEVFSFGAFDFFA
jgi:hypothetical protein